MITLRPRILIVEDEAEIAEFYRQTLQAADYEVWVVYTGEDALSQHGQFDPHLILLDVNLGVGIDGFKVIQRLRQVQREVCIVVLSARHSHFDIASGLDLGADNYIVKPIGPLELVARVNAEMRPIRRRLEAENPADLTLNFGSITLQFKNGKGQVQVETRRKNLSDIEYRVVLRLLKTPGIEVPVEELIKAGWRYAGQPTRDNQDLLDPCIYRLRKKFEDDDMIRHPYRGGFAIRPPTPIQPTSLP